MINRLDLAVAFMFADTWSRVFMIGITSEWIFIQILSLIALMGILDAWSSGYCVLRKQVAKNGL